MDKNLREIFDLFVTESTFLNADTFGNGHIHETYLVKTSGPQRDDYILQKINNIVFRNIPELQENLERVTDHIRKKISMIPGSDLKRECLQLIPARDGKSWITDKDGNSWRVFIYIRDHRSYDIVDSPEKAFEGGKAIGRFQALLADLPGGPLHETIPAFHDLEKRIGSFSKILENDPAGRLRSTVEETSFILERTGEMQIIQRLAREGKIPVRITHNDTKFNNILFDRNDRSLCIIDLDTVMPGYFHSDFGDAIRTGANIAAEDEKVLSEIEMDIRLFRAYAEGYLSETRNTLNDIEKEYLALAPLIMTYEQALRFLSDYIDGDKYYRIHHEQHNLQRTKAQIRLLQSMEQQYPEMREIVRDLV